MRVIAALVVFGTSLALLIDAGLGLDPYDVFAQRLARRTGATIGAVTIVTSLVLLLLRIPLLESVDPHRS